MPRKYEKRNPGNAARASAWSVPHVTHEAAGLFRLMKNTGMSVEEVERLIGVSDEEFAELSEWARSEPVLAGALDFSLIYRDEVLEAFRKLVAKEIPAKTEEPCKARLSQSAAQRQSPRRARARVSGFIPSRTVSHSNG